jgi:hypothetical protein
VIEIAVSPAELVAGTVARITLVAYEHDLTVADPGTVQLRLTRDDGTVLHDAPMTGTGATPRTVSIPASSLTQVDRLAARATAVDFVHEWVIPVVGSALFGIAAARMFDQGQLADPSRYPESFLIALRARIREAFTSVTGRRFVRELVTATVDTIDPDHAWLPRRRYRGAASPRGVAGRSLGSDRRRARRRARERRGLGAGDDVPSRTACPAGDVRRRAGYSSERDRPRSPAARGVVHGCTLVEPTRPRTQLLGRARHVQARDTGRRRIVVWVA